MALPSLDDQVTKDGSDRSTLGYRGMGDTSPSDDDGPDEDGADLGDLDEDGFLRLARAADSQGGTYFQTAVRPYWARNYRAYRSEHMAGSKYLSDHYKSRSKLYRPKTRDAVRKKLQAGASALFATGDVVSVTAANDGDDFQSASAALKQSLLNYRLSRESRRNGVRWFLVAMGQLQTANITGLCFSKQSWRYKEEKRGKPQVYAATQDAFGNQQQAKTDTSPLVTEDRPDIETLAPENVIFDPNCDWTNIAQSTQYIRIARPFAPDDAFQFISKATGAGKKIPFIEGITPDMLRSAETTTGPSDTIASRTARNDGRDPILLVNGAFGRCWLYEWFMRVRGQDYTFWTLGVSRLLSKPVLVSDAYPEQHGDRPIAIGYGAIEAFRTTPTSPVESWANLQLELNDMVNLRLDHLKQTVTPPMKYKRGAQVDLEAVQKRGPDRIIGVLNMDDIAPLGLPDIPASAQAQDAQINADFDSLSGVMNMGTVTTSRTMNETVGGMNLLAGDSSSMAEFDLTVWVETWVDPVIHQLLRLEEYYESDATVLALCGEKAKLFQRWGVSEITDQLLLAETTVTVKIGTGSANLPMQRLQKFQAATTTLMQMLGPFVQAGVIKTPTPKVKEIVETVYGAAGFSDGGDRFFEDLDDTMTPAPQQDPKAMAAASAADNARQKIMLDAQKHQTDTQLRVAEMQQRHQEMIMKMASDESALHAELLGQHMRATAELGRASLQNAHSRGMQAEDQQHSQQSANHSLLGRLFLSSVNQDVRGGPGPGGQSPGGDNQMAA